FSKYFSNALLGLSNPFRKEFWTLYTDKISFTFICSSFGHQRLSSTRWTIKQDTFRRCCVSIREYSDIFQKPFYCFLQLLLYRRKTTYIIPFNIWNFYK